MNGSISSLIDLPGLDPAFKTIASKIENRQRISPDEGLILFEKGYQPMFVFFHASSAPTPSFIQNARRAGN